MNQNEILLILLSLVLGAALGTVISIYRQRQRRLEQEKAFNEVQLREMALQAQLALTEGQRQDLKQQLLRFEAESDTKTSRLREVELELERLKLRDSSRGETETKLRSLEVELHAISEKLQNEMSQRQLQESRLADSQQAHQQQRQEFERRLMERETEIKAKDQGLKDLASNIARLEASNRSLNEETQKIVATLAAAHEELNREKVGLREEAERRRNELIERRKMNWIHHENAMIDQLKNLCKRLEIVYHDKKTFPLGKKPDFAIEVAGQYVVLDAKAPADPEHPENFYDYLRRQAEGLEKYLKQEGVRKDGFLVVPTDALPFLQERFFFEIGAFKIYVVTPESLEPALRLLLKIEEYDILQAMGPEAQDDIATFIGQASRMIKRRVQIDHFMSDKFIELLSSGELLPEDILAKAQSKEKNFQLNPPKLDRGKHLHRDELEKKQSQVGYLIERMKINSNLAADVLEKIPLISATETGIVAAPSEEDAAGKA